MGYTKTILTLGLLGISASAMAENALHEVRVAPEGVHIALVGHASMTVPNDHAHLLWTASAQADNLKAATAAAIEQMNGGIAALKGVSDNVQLKTMNINSYPVYSNTTNGSTPKVLAWRVTQTLALETDQIDQVPMFITAVDGRLELDNLNFSVSEASRATHQKELIRRAIADATQRAAFSAEALGYKPNRVQLKELVFEGADSVASNRVLMRATAKADYTTMPVPTIESGTTTLTLSVKANAVIR